MLASRPLELAPPPRGNPESATESADVNKPLDLRMGCAPIFPFIAWNRIAITIAIA